MAVQTIKAIARGPWAAGAKRDHPTWYQPLEGEADITKAVQWVLGRPGIFLNSAGDVGLLPTILRAAGGGHETISDAAMAELGQRTGMASIFGL